MTVIRTLSTSESNEQRDREKAKLEKDYQKCDKELDELISQHDGDLAQVMQTFGRVSMLVNTSRERISNVKENLLACKTLLSCRRDELKKLWLEGIEHKHTLQLLEEISQLKEVPSQLSAHLSKKHYLHATQVLVSALALGGSTLEDVEALRELRTQLEASKQQLYVKLLDELTRHIYVESTQDVLTSRLFRQGSMRDRESTPSPFDRSKRELTPGAINLRESFRSKKRLDFSSSAKSEKTTPLKVTEDVATLNPEEDSEHFMSILVECLGLLGKLNEAVENLKVEMQTELLRLVERTTKSLVGTEAPSPLVELLALLMEQFRAITAAHRVVLEQVRRTAATHRVNVSLYDLPDVWARVQAVMQLLLTDYLDIQNTMSEAHQVPSTFSEQSSNISSYFARRRQTSRSRRTPLFKFENSSHALTMTSLMKEQPSSVTGFKRLGDTSQREKVLVCQPDPNNITLIFVPLSKFLEEIEQVMGCSSGNPCTLNAFISDYIKDTFVRRQHVKMAARVESATKCQEAWKMPITPERAAELGLPRPLLHSTVLVEEGMQEMKVLMEALPWHAGSLLGVTVNVIHGYRETCQAAYRGIVQPHPEDKRVCSAAWLNDDDISRFLKSLPNWTNLKAQKSLQSRKTIKREDTVEEESPEDVRQRNIKEAEILASNLGEGGINSHEIISDVAQLKCLALLQESMEWFSWRITQFTNQLHQGRQSHHLSPSVPSISVTSTDVPAVPEGTVIALENLAHEFEELANTCLLVLHLEVRVQCFYYLLPRAMERFSTHSQDPDPRVIELSRVLASVDEAMTSSLQPRKSKYVFEGLGHLVAKILMSSSQYLEMIDENGIHRMCRNIFILQQTLANITMTREVALDHANQYFQLFHLSPEDILNQVLESGPQFSELEYMNALQLIHRSRPQHDLQRHLQRLSDILGEVGVTV